MPRTTFLSTVLGRITGYEPAIVTTAPPLPSPRPSICFYFQMRPLLFSLLLLIAGTGGNLLPGDPGGGGSDHHPHHHHHDDHPHHHHDDEDAHPHHHDDDPKHQHHDEEDAASNHHHKHDDDHGHDDDSRDGRAEEGGRGDEVIDFAEAVMDPETGLKCVFKNVTVQSLDKGTDSRQSVNYILQYSIKYRKQQQLKLSKM